MNASSTRRVLIDAGIENIHIAVYDSLSGSKDDELFKDIKFKNNDDIHKLFDEYKVWDIINNPEKSSDSFDAEEVFAVYHTALQTINEKYREIILLRYKENRPLDEICKILKGDKKSIKNTLFRAKTALSEQMNYYRGQL